MERRKLGDKTLRLILKYSYPVSQISEISQGCFIFANCILLSFSSMKHLPYLGALLCLLVTTCLSCKSSSPYPGNETNTLHKRESGPFYHSVASGNPAARGFDMDKGDSGLQKERNP